MTEALFDLAPGTAKEPDGWDTFWSCYPRHSARVDAARAYRKLNPSPALQAEMLAALVSQKMSRQWQDPRYIPLAASWIRGERWADESSKPIQPALATSAVRSRAESYRRNVWAMRCYHEPQCPLYADCIDAIMDALSKGDTP